jgi:hypothetical protein
MAPDSETENTVTLEETLGDAGGEVPEGENEESQEGENEESQEGEILEEDGVPLDETIKSYRILGMVDFTDEQGNIRGQLPVGSVQQLPAYAGNLAVEEGRAEEVQ